MSTIRSTDGTAAFDRLHEVVNSGDAQLIEKTIDEVTAPDVVVRTPLPIGTTGAQALKEVFRRLRHAFPDLHIAVEDTIAEGDKVVFRNTVTGTHRGEYMGVAPTGKTIRYEEIFILRTAGGRIAELWGVVDIAAQMRQLGLLPALPGASPGPAVDRG
ncbi:MAG TPA: ester cyclase [Actinocrinis sp.]|nr:ester cyclase [Actinocrinis sp.]